MSVSQVLNITMELWGILFCLLAAITSFVPGYRNETERCLVNLEFINAFLLIADVFAWLFRGNVSTAGYYVVRISNFMVYILTYTLIVFFADYLLCFIGRKSKAGKNLLRISCILAAIGYLMTVTNVFTGWLYYFDEKNLYTRGPGAIYGWAIGFVVIICTFIAMLIKYNELSSARFFGFCSYIFLPLVAILIQVNFYGVSLTNVTYTIIILIMFFVNVVERGKELAEQERSMSEMHTKIMLSQIQPHFLYNSLTAIYYLCDIDPKKAKDAVSRFSDYLRTNMDSLKENHPVAFKKEMDHVDNYLQLELLRFDEDLRVTYDVRETDFELPALTIQPIVENAVKYGVGKKIGGGTVKISTRKEDGYYIIEVEDDGAGYDVNETKDDGRTHIGIDNVRSRLENMVGGSLEIHSELGVGTHATIKIPV